MQGKELLVKKTYTIDEIKDDPHGHAELLEIQAPVIVDVGQIPDPLELVIAELAVLQHRGCLSAGEVFPAACKR